MRVHCGYLLTAFISILSSITFAIAANTLPDKGNVEISLTSNWTETSFKLNVLESIANINSSLYEPLVLKLLNIEVDLESGESNLIENPEEISDSEFYEYALSLLNSDVDKALADLDISNKIMTPRIQAHYSYYKSHIKSLHTCSENSVFFDSFGEEFYCDQDAAFMLRTADYAMSYEDLKLPFDTLIGSPSSTSVIYVIYGDYRSQYFRTMFYNLYQFTLTGRFNLIWRYVSPEDSSDKPEILSGYGAALNLKRTDYIAIDDRGFSDEQQQRLDFSQNVEYDNQVNSPNIFDSKFVNIKPIKEDDVQLLGLKTTKFINEAKDKLSTLVNLLSEFPKYANYISNLDYTDDELAEIMSVTEESYRSGIPTGIYINNAVIPYQKTDIFEILKTIKRELSFTKMFESIGLNYNESKDIMTKFANNMLDLFRSPSRRYDFSKFSKTIIYLNDIETDTRYTEFMDDSKRAYSSRPTPGRLPMAKENIYELIFAIDITNSLQLQYLINFYDTVFTQKIPIKIGIIPFLDTSRWNGKAVSKLYGTYHELGPREAYNYLLMLNRFVSSKEPLTLMSFRALDYPYLDDSLKWRYIDNLPNLYETFDLFKEKPSVIANGIIYNFNEIDSALNQIFEDMFYLFGSLHNKKIPANMKLSKFLRKDAIKLKNNDLIPDKVSQYKDNFLPPPGYIPSRHWQSIDLFGIVKKPYRNEALVTINLMGSFLHEEYIHQVVELLKYSKKAKGVKIVISDIHATSAFKELISLSDYDDQLNFLTTLSDTHIQDDFEVRDTHINIKEMFGFDYKYHHDMNMVIAGRKITIKNILPTDVIASIVKFERSSRLNGLKKIYMEKEPTIKYDNDFDKFEFYSWVVSYSYFYPYSEYFLADSLPRISTENLPFENSIHNFEVDNELLNVQIVIDPVSEEAQELISFIPLFEKIPNLSLHIHLRPNPSIESLPIKRFYKGLINTKPLELTNNIVFNNVPEETLFNVGLDTPQRWMVAIKDASTDLDNLKLDLTDSYSAYGEFILKHILVEGYAVYYQNNKPYPPASLPVELVGDVKSDTNIMQNLGYFQLKANPGMWKFQIKEYTRGSDIFKLPVPINIGIVDLDGCVIRPVFEKRWGMETVSLIEPIRGDVDENLFTKFYLQIKDIYNGLFSVSKKQADINIFTVASGHLYERFLGIMIASVMKQTTHTVKFWLIENYMSPDFKNHLPILAQKYGFEYELVMYNWPIWLNGQRERQRTIWGYKILFLDVLFPQDLEKVIFVDSDQIVRTDLKELVDIDLEGAPYGYTPMGESRTEMEGFRFWKQGYWETYLGDELKYHISALYVVDLVRFRKIAAGDILRQHYQQLSYDPNSLSNLDQDLPNNLQRVLPIFSLPDEWLWCETWCSDESLKNAKTIDLCNNPLTKEPKLDRARRQIKEWVELDNEVSDLISGKVGIDSDKISHDEL